MPFSEIVKYFFLSLVPIGVIFLIINGIIRNQNVKKRAIINLVIGLSLFIIFLGAILIDYFVFGQKDIKHKLYFSFPIGILIFTLAISINLFSYAKKYNIRMPRNRKMVKIKTEDVKEDTSSEEKEIPNFKKVPGYVYIVFQYGNYILLDYQNNHYQGYIREIKERFPKETIQKVIDNKKIKAQDINFVGKVLGQDKIHFCYLINIESISEELNLIKANKYELGSFLEEGLDKEIILRVLIGESFTIEND